MWSPIKKTCSPLYLASRFLVLFGILALAGCGYGFGTDGPSVLTTPTKGPTSSAAALPPLSGDIPTLKFKNVENPTLFPWLSYVIRTEVHDEFAARKLCRWVDSGKADYEIAIKVDNYTYRSWLTDTDNATMLYTAAMTLNATFYRADSNEVVWQSGNITYSQSYESVQERIAASELSRELARRLASSMRQAF